jgi:hypothetical protein
LRTSFQILFILTQALENVKVLALNACITKNFTGSISCCHYSYIRIMLEKHVVNRTLDHHIYKVSFVDIIFDHSTFLLEVNQLNWLKNHCSHVFVYYRKETEVFD